MKPDYMEALTYKNLLLRLQATTETDPAAKQELIAEADKLRDQAIKIRDAQNKWDAVPANAVRVGGGIGAADEDQGREADLPARCAGREGRGSRDHRGGDWRGRQGPRRAGAPVDSDARPGGDSKPSSSGSSRRRSSMAPPYRW